MRKFIVPAILLSICVFAVPSLQAQACNYVTGLGEITPASANCQMLDGAPFCAATSPTMLEVAVRYEFSPNPPCPAIYTWSFSDSPRTITTTEPRVERVFSSNAPRPNEVNMVRVTVTAAGRTAETTIGSALGLITATLDKNVITEGEQVVLTFRRTDASAQAYIEATATTTARTYPNGYLGPFILEKGEYERRFTLSTYDDRLFHPPSHTSIAFTRTTNYRMAVRGVDYDVADDDDPQPYHFADESMTVRESAGNIEVTVVASPTAAARERFAIVAAPTPRADSPIQEFTATFDGLVTRSTVRIPVENDTLYRGPQTYNLELRDGSGAQLDTLTVRVLDDETPPQFTLSQTTFNETDADQLVPLTLTLASHPGADADFSISVASGGTADPSDYILRDEQFHWFPGDKTKAFNVTIKADRRAEFDETVMLQVFGPEGLIQTMPLTIRDDDRAPFEFAFDASAYGVSERNASAVVRRVGAAGTPADFIVRASGRIPIPWSYEVPVHFEAAETAKSVPLLLDDNWYTNVREGTLELIAQGLTHATAPLTVRDDEQQPMISLGDATVVEGAAGETPVATFPLMLSAPAGADIHLLVSTVARSATDGDFVRLDRYPITIRAGERSAAVRVTVVGDNTPETTERFGLQITSCCSGLATLGNATANGTIRTDDGPPVAYSLSLDRSWFSNGAYTTYEAYVWLDVRVERSGDLEQPSVATVSFTATNAPFTYAPVALRFEPDQTVRTARFLIDDDVYASVQGVLELRDSTGAVTTRTTVRIEENEREPRVIVGNTTLYLYDSRPNRPPVTLTLDPPLPRDVRLTLLRPGAADMIIDVAALTRQVQVPFASVASTTRPDQLCQIVVM
ncbi:MAG: hypothetical protein M3Q69_15940, partial [Acidobacteriota bacterium]|nr:hypothetical protein [Acidobacteriota bacterium]